MFYHCLVLFFCIDIIYFLIQIAWTIRVLQAKPHQYFIYAVFLSVPTYPHHLLYWHIMDKFHTSSIRIYSSVLRGGNSY